MKYGLKGGGGVVSLREARVWGDMMKSSKKVD